MDSRRQRKHPKDEKSEARIKSESYNSESEGDSEAENSYQTDSFVVPDDEESSFAEESEEDHNRTKAITAKKEKKKPKINYELNSEDEELIKEFEMKNKSRLRKLNQNDKQPKRREDSEDFDKADRLEAEEGSSNSFVERERSDNQAFATNKKPTNAVLQRLFKEDEIAEEEHKKQIEAVTKNVQSLELKDIFEPGDLAVNYETAFDRFIVQSDRPERLQLRLKNVDLPTNEEILLETNWIVQRLIQKTKSLYGDPNFLKPKVIKILEYIRLANCEVMYIWNYKQQEFATEPKKGGDNQDLRLADLWDIYELHMEWVEVYKKHRNIVKLFDVLTQHISISQSLRNAMSNCYDSRMLGFFSDFVEYNLKKFLTNREINKILETSLNEEVPKKMEQRPVSFEIQRLNLHKVAESISITAEQLAENLEANERIHAPVYLQETPEIIATRCSRSDVGFLMDPLKSLSTICEYIATEYFHHPIVRTYLKRLMIEKVSLSTRPTEKGKSMTVYDYYYPTKRINEKRPNTISSELWLLILEAETKGLITVHFHFGPDIENKRTIDMENKFKGFLLANPWRKEMEKFDMVQAWDIVRDEIVSKLFKNYAVTDFEAQLRKELSETAEKFVISKCCAALKELVNMRPYKGEEGVVTLSCSNDEETAVFVVLNQFGEMVESVRLMNILRKGTDQDPSYRLLVQNDEQAIEHLMRKHSPGLVIVSPKNLMSRVLKNKLNEINDLAYGATRGPFVMWGNTIVSSAFANSSVGEKLMKDYPILTKEAVSMARYVQNPLAETLNLWHENERENMFLYMTFSPFQHHVSKFKLKNEFENLLVEVVNSVGVDINLCAKYKHYAAQLQFLCGLGPRKAKKLIEKLKADNVTIKSRSQLYNVYLPKNIYVNAIGFVRIDSRFSIKKFDGQIFEDVEWLDYTRIHPDNYKIAKKIAADAYDDAQLDENQAVLQVIKDASKLQELDLEDYAKYLSQKANANMFVVVNFIVKELEEPFRDPRAEFRTNPNKEDIFYSLSGESKYHLKEESIITVKILSIDDKGLRVVTDSGLIGNVNKEDIKDGIQEFKESELRNLFVVGSFVKAKVKNINYEHMKLRLSLKLEDLLNHKEYLRKNDILERIGLSEHNWFIISKEEDFPVITLEGRRKVNRFTPRKINHPYFKNIGLNNAQEFLSERKNGEFIFRPSSKGIDHLNLTWRLFEDVYVHLTITEGFKNPNEQISSSLTMDKREFESLDDIIANYIKPCNNIVDGIIRNEKFLPNNIDYVKQTLIDEKNANSSKIPYYFSFSSEASQFLVLSYILHKLTVKHELIKIKPDGLHFHGLTFPNLPHLIKYFKENLKTKEYLKYTDSLPRVEFGVKAKSEFKEEADIKEEHRGKRRRSRYDEDSSPERSRRHKKEYRDRDSSIKRDSRNAPHYSRRRRRSESSLESVSQSPAKRVKTEHRSYVKEEAYNYANNRNLRNPPNEYKAYGVKFESAHN